MSTVRRTCAACLLTWALLTSASAQTSQPLPGLTEGETAKLLRCRAIIENAADSDNTRRGQAEELLLTGWSPALDVLAELLGSGGDGGAAAIVAGAVANVGRDHPERLDARLVEPLLRLLSEGGASACPAASAALATFRDDRVIQRLGGLAAEAARPLKVRLTAIDALAPNVDLRSVIAQLIPLLSVPAPDVVERALAALAPASRVNHGRNLEEWQKWWKEKSGLDETAWLKDRLELVSQRARDLQAEVDGLRREHDHRYSALAKRLGDVLRLNLRLTPQAAQRDELLVGWLRDPLVDFRLAAVALLAEQIYDQQKPSETVRAALRERYADPMVEVRRAALELVGALSDPADLDPILLRLAVEHDVDVRETILGVLGKLRNPAAIPVLIDEIADESAFANCVTKAAQSLAVLARDFADPAALARAVGPLQTRLARHEGGNPRVRGALLAAMASIGSADFAAEYVAHLNEDYPEVLLPSIRGVMLIGDRNQVPRLRALMGHADPRVRTQVIEAVGVLGGDAADLEGLLNRMTQAAEPNEAVRTAAWSAFCKLLQGRSADMRLSWAARLKDLPEKQAEYLTMLVADWSAGNPAPAELPDARDRLARLLLSQRRYAEAARHLEELYDYPPAAGNGSAAEVGLLLLDATLRSGTYDRLDALLPRLATLDGDVRSAVVATINAYLAEALKTNDNPTLPELVGRLERVSGDLFGEDFRAYLRGVRQRLLSPPAESSASGT